MIQFLEILVGFSLDPNICLSVSAGKPGVSEFLIVAEINILSFGERKNHFAPSGYIIIRF